MRRSGLAFFSGKHLAEMNQCLSDIAAETQHERYEDNGQSEADDCRSGSAIEPRRFKFARRFLLGRWLGGNKIVRLMKSEQTRSSKRGSNFVHRQVLLGGRRGFIENRFRFFGNAGSNLWRGFYLRCC